MLSEQQYKAVVRASAWYDLIITAPFMTPWSLVFVLNVLRDLHLWSGLPGAIPEFEISHLLFGGLLGSVVVVWSLVRLRLNLAILGRYDALARCLFALWQIYAVANGASILLLSFTVFELAFGLAQLARYEHEGSALGAMAARAG